jgi:hemerythrin
LGNWNITVSDDEKPQEKNVAQTVVGSAAWADRLALGIRKIEDQHMKLIALVNQISDSASLGRSQHVLSKILSVLQLYALTHFDAEEELMRQHGYDGLEDHLNEHRRFVGTVNGFRERLDAGGDPLVSAEVGTFLRMWMATHIMDDLEFFRMLKQAG